MRRTHGAGEGCGYLHVSVQASGPAFRDRPVLRVPPMALAGRLGLGTMAFGYATQSRMVHVCFIGGPYDGTSQPLPPLSEGDRLNVSGNQATPAEQDGDRGSKVCEGQWHPYIVRWRDGELVAVYEPLEAGQD